MPAAQSEQRALFIDVSYCLELFVFHFEVIKLTAHCITIVWILVDGVNFTTT